MRSVAWMLVSLLFAEAAFAGVRSPAGCFPNQYPCGPRCTFLVHGMSSQSPCQFRFRADGGLDRLTLTVTLRDSFDQPAPDCSTTVALEEGTNTVALCGCCELSQGAVSGPDGEMQFVFAGLGGRGKLWLTLTTHCRGDVNWFTAEVPFTSPDLNGSCEPHVSTDVVDLGIWAGCLPPGPYCVRSDLSCDEKVNVIDLGVLASGLSRGCDDAACP